MKRVIAITAALFVTAASLASAQTSGSGGTAPSIADVAKAEEERRKTVKKPARVFTNGNLRADISKGIAAPPATPATDATAANATPGAPGTEKPPAAASAAEGAKDQAYWAGRMSAARTTLQRTQMFADSLQSRINALMTEFVNRDDPAQKAKLEADRKAALAELEKVKKELADQNKAITAIEEEARRAGVPSGWLRPGA